MLLVLVGGAVTVEDVCVLFVAVVVVDVQQAEARMQAMRDGLAEVLVSATGYGASAQDPGLADLLDNAPRYVQQYRYRTVRATDTTPATLALWMSFDAKAINQSLRERGQPVWGSARPLLLVWLALETGSERRLVSAAESVAWPALETAARRRGLPLRLPLLDLEDQARVTAADVWGGFQETVVTASARYQPQAILLGRLYHDRQGGWHARWTLRIGEEVLHWDNTGAVPDEVLTAGVESSADALAARFAQVGAVGGGTQLSLHISDVNSLADYARLLRYLSSLSGVSAVQVTAVQGGTVSCRLTLEVGPDAVARTIGLGTTLAALPGMAEPLSLERQYRLLP
jgi:hypothetical protein